MVVVWVDDEKGHMNIPRPPRGHENRILAPDWPIFKNQEKRICGYDRVIVYLLEVQ